MLFEGRRPGGRKGGKRGCRREAGHEGREDGKNKPDGSCLLECSPHAKQGAKGFMAPSQGVLKSAFKGGGIPRTVLRR